ncbi:hypothetical protein GF322_01220 [Candidatus Dependentiae bacterium]|nr:hypothetical protein [Candidatus Dependentiae bacterium]
MNKVIYFLIYLFFLANKFSILICMQSSSMTIPTESPQEAFSKMESQKLYLGKIDNPQASKKKDQVDQLRDQIENIDKQESQLLDQLQRIDNKFNTAIDLASEARKLKSELLKSKDVKEAADILKKAKENLKKIEKIKNNIRIEVARKFDIVINQLEASMKNVQEKVDNLEKKGLAAKKIELPEEEIVEIENVVEQEEAKELLTQESILFRGAVAVVAFIIGSIRSIGNWFARVFKKAVVNSKTEIHIDEKNINQTRNIASVDIKTETKKELVKKHPEVKDPVLQEINKEMNQLQKSASKLEMEKEKIVNKRKKLEEIKSRRLDQIRKKVELMNRLELETYTKQMEISRPKWKRFAETVFSRFLDGISFIFKKIKLYTVRFYQNFLKEKIRRFMVAVQHRVEEIETQDDVKEKDLNIEIEKMDVELQNGEDQVSDIESESMVYEVEIPEEMPPKPIPQDMMGPPPTTSGMGI